MASKYKTAAKAELVAIYRLEFYKKQRNWKFCKDVCKTTPDPKPEPERPLEPTKPPELSSNKPILNETYNIVEPEGDPTNSGADASALNDAFVETDSDKIIPTTPPDPEGACWPDVDMAPPLEGAAAGAQPEGLWGAEAWTQGDGVWARAEYAWQNVQLECGGEEAFAPQASGAPWEDGRDWPAAKSQCGDFEDTSCLPALLGAADQLLRDSESPQLHATCEEWSSWSLESVSGSEFLRGAAAAPHSSEILLPQQGEEEPPGSVGWLSSPQLARRVCRHAAALRDLVAEARRRGREQHILASLSLDRRPLSALPNDPPTRDYENYTHEDLFTTPHIDAYNINPLPTGYNNNFPENYNKLDLGNASEYGKYLVSNLGLHSNPTPEFKDPNLIRSYRDPTFKDPTSKESYLKPSLGLYNDPALLGCLNDPIAVKDIHRDKFGPYIEGSFKDPFVAGSFKNTTEVGRGRGRLRKEKLIGIGMGRPYRL